MKLWRKLAKKETDGTRNGREIRYQLYIGEQIAKQNKRSYPLLDKLLERSGMTFVL